MTIFKLNGNILCTGLLLGSLAAAVPLLAAGRAATNDYDDGRGGHEHDSPSGLVELVRRATRHYMNPDSTVGTGYEPPFGCVSGPDHGAMGVHYINMTLVGDGEIDAWQPEALIYEPSKGGGGRLVGVEYIVDSATWLAHHKAPPMLEGQAFQLVGSPNRYGLQPFFELHVWAYRQNPKGAFVDWNNHVTCENQ